MSLKSYMVTIIVLVPRPSHMLHNLCSLRLILATFEFLVLETELAQAPHWEILSPEMWYGRNRTL